jgi:probable biosynthetic protein (TIGR04098 family)
MKTDEYLAQNPIADVRTVTPFRIHRVFDRLGMPELVSSGLSESWLLAQCGDLHWQLLSQLFGLPPNQFHDEHGTRLLPGIVSIDLSSARGLHEFQEDSGLVIESELLAYERGNALSSHRANQKSSGASVVVIMLTRFLSRTKARSNSSLVGADPADIPGISFGDLIAHDIYLTHRKARRTKRPSGDCVLNLCDAERIFTFSPCPSTDFNGAGLLYFARFPDLIERAEWHLSDRINGNPGSILSRQIQYFGNIDPGDSLGIQIFEVSRDAGGSIHNSVLVRLSDNRVICQAITQKKYTADRSIAEDLGSMANKQTLKSTPIQ